MWALLALFAASCFTAVFIAFRLLEDAKVPSIATMLYIFFLGAVISFIHLRATDTSAAISKKSFLIVLVAAVFSYFGNLAQIRSMGMAPNPGYSAAVASCQAIFLTILSIFIFGSDFSLLKGLGVALCVIGVSLVSVG